MDERYYKLLKRQNALLSTLVVLVLVLIVGLGASGLYIKNDVMPKVDAMVTEVDKVAVQLGDLSTEIENSGITDTLSTVNDIDIESLNTAISELKAVVDGISSIFGR